MTTMFKIFTATTDQAHSPSFVQSLQIIIIHKLQQIERVNHATAAQEISIPTQATIFFLSCTNSALEARNGRTRKSVVSPRIELWA